MNEKDMNSHSQKKRIFKCVGFILLAIGVPFLIVGLVDFFSAFANMTSPSLFWMCFVGLFLSGIGGAFLKLGYMKEMNRYVANEAAPVSKDFANYMIDGTREEIQKTVQEVKQNDNKGPICPSCGTVNEPSAHFCDNCGKQLGIICSDCKEVNDLDAKFCRKCGKKL